MVEEYKRKKHNSNTIVSFLNKNSDYDFYITEQNSRYYITDENSLSKLLKQSVKTYTLIEKGDCKGIIILWKSTGGDKKRYYVKMNATDKINADKILTVLLWNTDKELFVKIRKESKFLSVFKRKGFRFKGGRGCQVLLHRKCPIKKETK